MSSMHVQEEFISNSRIKGERNKYAAHFVIKCLKDYYTTLSVILGQRLLCWGWWWVLGVTLVLLLVI